MKRRAATSTLPWIHGFQLCTSPSSPSQCQSRRRTNGSITRVRASCAHPLPDAGVAGVQLGGRAGGRSTRAGRRPRPRRGRGTDRCTVASTDPWRSERVVVGGPAPARLLAQQPDAVRDLVDPAVVEGDGRGDHGATQALLAGERELLPAVPVAIPIHAGSRAGQGLRPGCSEVGPGPSDDVVASRSVGGSGRAIPHRSGGRRRHGKSAVRGQQLRKGVPDPAWLDPAQALELGSDWRGVGHKTNITDHRLMRNMS